MFAILTGAILFASCEKSRPVTYTGNNFVHFQDSLVSVSESSAKEDANGNIQSIPSLATIRINRATSDISKDLVVSFSITAKYVKIDTLTGSPTNGEEIEVGDVPQGQFYLSSPSNITIKAGEAFAFLTVTAVNNDDVDGNKKLTITLESTSDASFSLGYPGPDKKNKSNVLYIVDDDCPLDISKFVGTLKVEDNAVGSPPLANTYNVTSTQISTNSIAITGLFDPATRYPTPTPCPAPVVIVFNTATKDVLFTPATQNAYYRAGTCPSTTQPRVVFLDAAVPSKINTCDGSFTLNYFVQNPAAASPFDVVTSKIKK
ncbi:hypothetical protein AD998_03330 [bacterium 336/3]|nr:hypothetical protein AD998_03330 [bacterium 336/3]